jgi:hypothetical protein
MTTEEKRITVDRKLTTRTTLDLPARVAIATGTVGVLYRIALLIAGLPPTNSDEATMGLMARHILAGERAPVFFYAQHYMGALEAYLAVPFFAVAGPSTVALRLSNVVLYAAFLIAMYHLTRRLFTPWFAVAVVALLALGSDRVVKDQLISGGGYPEINAIAAGLLLAAIVPPRRPAGYALFGLAAGLALWSDLLVAPYLAVACGLLVWSRFRQLLGWAGAALTGGLLLGLAPVIAHDLTNPARSRSLRVLTDLSRAGREQLGDAGLADYLHGGVLFGIPMATGLCQPGRCGSAQLWWGATFVVLLAVSAALAVYGMRRAADREARVRHAARLGLVVAALVTVWLYAKSPAAVLTPVESARYLSCLLISVPAALWPLWQAAVRAPRALAAAAVAMLAAVALASGAATIAVLAEIPGVRAAARAQSELVAELDRQGARRIYSDYWTCNRLVFATRERILCAVLGDDLQPGLDRYRPYRDAVAAAPDPAYVFPAGSTVDNAFAAQHPTAAPRSVAGYHIYRGT